MPPYVKPSNPITDPIHAVFDPIVPDWAKRWPFTDPKGKKAPRNYVKRLNYVVHAWADPCQAPWTVYAQTMGPALLRLALRFYTIDFWDIYVNMMRPAHIMPKGPHRARGNRPPYGKDGWFRHAKELAKDPWGRIGKLLGDLTGIKERRITPGIAHLWVIELKFERLLFWFWIFELISDFFWQWTTLLYQTRWCQQSGDDVAMGVGQGGALIGLAYTPFFIQHEVKQRGAAHATSGGGSFTAKGRYIVTATAEVTNTTGHAMVITAGFQIAGGGFSARDVVGLAPNATGSVTLDGEFTGPGVCIGVGKTDGGLAIVGQVEVHVFGKRTFA